MCKVVFKFSYNSHQDRLRRVPLPLLPLPLPRHDLLVHTLRESLVITIDSNARHPRPHVRSKPAQQPRRPSPVGLVFVIALPPVANITRPRIVVWGREEQTLEAFATDLRKWAALQFLEGCVVLSLFLFFSSGSAGIASIGGSAGSGPRRHGCRCSVDSIPRIRNSGIKLRRRIALAPRQVWWSRLSRTTKERRGGAVGDIC